MKTRDFIQRLGRITSDYILLARGKRRARARQINSEAPAQIGWVGLGSMGSRMAPSARQLNIFTRGSLATGRVVQTGTKITKII
jgi:hypothetical protein